MATYNMLPPSTITTTVNGRSYAGTNNTPYNGIPDFDAPMLSANGWTYLTNNPLVVIADSSTARTFALTDASTRVVFSSASAKTATVPPNSSVAFPIGTKIEIEQTGVGILTVAAGSGVTIHAPTGLVFNQKYQGGELRKTATDTWELAIFNPFDQWIIDNTGTYTLATQTAVQALFNSPTNGKLSVDVGTYDFECQFALSALSATSASFGFALGATDSAVIGSQGWACIAMKSTLATPAATVSTYNVAANTALTAAGTGTVGWANINGVFRVTTAGTITPQVSLGTITGSPTPAVGIGSFFRCRQIGNATTTYVGNWT